MDPVTCRETKSFEVADCVTARGEEVDTVACHKAGSAEVHDTVAASVGSILGDAQQFLASARERAVPS